MTLIQVMKNIRYMNLIVMATTLMTMTANVPSFRSYVQRFVRMAFFFNASFNYCRLYFLPQANNHNINIMGNWGTGGLMIILIQLLN